MQPVSRNFERVCRACPISIATTYQSRIGLELLGRNGQRDREDSVQSKCGHQVCGNAHPDWMAVRIRRTHCAIHESGAAGALQGDSAHICAWRNLVPGSERRAARDKQCRGIHGSVRCGSAHHDGDDFVRSEAGGEIAKLEMPLRIGGCLHDNLGISAWRPL